MPLLIDLNFHSNKGFKDTRQILEKQKPALQFSRYLENDILFIKHADVDETRTLENIKYIFFKKGNGLFSFPIKTFLYLRKLKPKIILVQGFIFPFQLILLKLFIPGKIKIIVQHHGELPFTGIKYVLQKFSGRFINACLFTSIENSIIWKQLKVIPPSCSCFEVLEASTDFKYFDKSSSIKKQFKMEGSFNYLWVGRLNSNKDPLTVIRAFADYHKLNPAAKLFMIFQNDELLPAINDIISKENMSGFISLIGKVQHYELEKWFNAADFYISGSHKEGSGYALIEAMACGCIPIITNIPSFRKITDFGNFGLLFEAGNKNDLLSRLILSSEVHQDKFSKKIVEHFHSKLSYQSIAKDLDKVCNLLLDQ